MHIILFFIDGLGLAAEGAANPLATTPLPCLQQLLEGKSLTSEAVGTSTATTTLLALDATLGVPGEPQSATGQTSLFTGVNAAQAVGYHVRGFPTAPLQKILAAEGILKKITALNKKATFLNTYRPQYFQQPPQDRQAAATTLLSLAAGLPLHTIDDLLSGRTLSADITSELWREQGLPVPYVPPLEAGQRVTANAQQYDFVFYEYFLTDHFAHKRAQAQLAQSLTNIDGFLAGMLQKLDLADTMLIVTSDHGNLEDNTSSLHTHNPVPLLLVGAGREQLPSLTDLTDLTPFILTKLQS
ncbi:MAG TPA: hypothetical protein VFC74_09225 [Oscillospiraceae bacterium]|nr:hypothetical protein [Oscillospiraceae bacterium]